jgi:hypothetical protein
MAMDRRQASCLPAIVLSNLWMRTPLMDFFSIIQAAGPQLNDTR